MAKPRALPTVETGADLDVTEVIRKHGRDVTRWAARLGGPRSDLEDVVQEVFCVVARRLHQLREPAKLRSWLFQITRNVTRSHRRRVRWRRWMLGGTDDVADGVPSMYPSPLEEVQRRQAAQILYHALDALRDKDREVIVLFEIDGLSGDEVAELTNSSPGAVYVRLHRARKRLLAEIARIEGETSHD